MGIFKNITKVLKKAAPIIGGTIGFAVGGPMGASIGSGIGSLASGRSVEESLMNAALAYGAGSLAKGAGFTKAPDSATGFSKLLPGRQVAGMDFGTTVAPNFGIGAKDAVPMTDMLKTSGNPLFKLIGENPMLTAAGVGSLAALGLGDEEESKATGRRDYPEGVYRGGKLMTTGDDGSMNYYEGSDDVQRAAYFDQLRKNQGSKKEVVNNYDNFGVFAAANGGEVKGPGTGTSDSVPARLSDGEFVVTADAVRGAGGGDRNVGAARMYDMMSQLERVA